MVECTKAIHDLESHCVSRCDIYLHPIYRYNEHDFSLMLLLYATEDNVHDVYDSVNFCDIKRRKRLPKSHNELHRDLIASAQSQVHYYTPTQPPHICFIINIYDSV